MYRVCPSTRLPSDCSPQPLIAWKAKSLFATTLSNSVSRFTKSTFFDFTFIFWRTSLLFNTSILNVWCTITVDKNVNLTNVCLKKQIFLQIIIIFVYCYLFSLKKLQRKLQNLSIYLSCHKNEATHYNTF